MNSKMFTRILKINHLNNDLRMFLLIAVINSLAYFWYSSQFGIYEDDHFRIPEAINMTLGELRNTLSYYWLNLSATQGRPLHIIAIFLGSFIGFQLGGLWGIYMIAYLITTLTIFLFYKLLSRLQVSPVFTICGTLAFALFPSDTTRIWLTGVFGIYSSLIFLLLALQSYLSNQKIIAYILMTISLFWYETVFLLFITAPLFTFNQSKNLVKELLQNVLILGIIFASVIFIRKIGGESRVTDLKLGETIKTVIFQSLLGPITSLKMFIYATWTSFKSIFSENLIIFTIVAFVIILISLFYFLQAKESSSNQKIKLLSGIGCLTLILAYPLTFTVSATVINGAGTRVHLAAIFGSSLIIGCLCHLIFSVFKHYRQSRIAIVIISCYFSLLVTAGILIQKDYRLNWQYQQDFWSQLLPLITDINQDNIILIDRQNFDLDDTDQMRANHWNLPIVLQQIYQFPSSWNTYPKVYLSAYNWQDKIVTDSGSFLLNTSTLEAASVHLPVPNQDSTINSNQLILIESKGGKLLRRLQPLIINQNVFKLKEKTNINLQSFPHKPFYKVLISQDSTRP